MVVVSELNLELKSRQSAEAGDDGGCCSVVGTRVDWVVLLLLELLLLALLLLLLLLLESTGKEVEVEDAILRSNASAAA